MATLLAKVCFVFLVLEIFIGMVANGSIILINFIDWSRRRKLSPADLILTCLGLARLLLQALQILNVTLFLLLNKTLSSVLAMLPVVWTFMSSVNLCFASCLSVFYLAKIAVFSHPVFLQVKRRISGLMPWLLLGSVVLSAVLTIIHIIIIIIMTSWSDGFSTCNPYTPRLSNRSSAEIHMPVICRHILVLFATFEFIPLMVFFSSSIFLISSLWKHVRYVEHNATGSKDLNTQAHWSVIKALASFAVLYLLSIAADNFNALQVWSNQHTWTIGLYNVSVLYPSGHAIVLILINPKLKQVWVRKLHHLKCGLWCKISRNFKPMPEKTGAEGNENLGEILEKFWGERQAV